MKKTFFLIFLFLIGALSFFSLREEFIPEKGDLLLTYPRSGTNWTIGVLQAFSKRPVRFIHKPQLKQHLGLNRLAVPIDESLPILYRTHSVTNAVKKLNQSQFRLLFTLRNYKECLVKEGQFTEKQFLEAVRLRDPLVEMYFENLRFFDQGWKNPETKHLIVYEEVISNPERVILDLLTFFKENLALFPEFFQNYSEWNEKMLSSYHGQHEKKGPSSQNQPIFHTQAFSKETLVEVDALLQERYPDLFEKYLKRYLLVQNT
jgi:hypothetical protein